MTALEKKQKLTEIINGLTIKELFELALTNDRLMWIQHNILDPNDLSRTYDEWVELQIDTNVETIYQELRT